MYSSEDAELCTILPSNTNQLLQCLCHLHCGKGAGRIPCWEMAPCSTFSSNLVIRLYSHNVLGQTIKKGIWKVKISRYFCQNSSNFEL